MLERDKIIKGLECCFKYETHVASGLVCEECPYNKNDYFGTCTAVLLREAIELLKEQERQIRFLKNMQKQMVGSFSDADLGNMVSKAFNWNDFQG